MPQLKPERTSETFEEVELDEVELEEALRKAREEKFYRQQREAYNAKLNADLIPRKYTFEQLHNFFVDKLKIDEFNQAIVIQLCHYFSGDERFTGDPRKGLLLVGGVGIGKSTMMQFFSRNQVASYRLMSCRDIESDFSSDGEKSVQACSYNIDIATNSDPFGHKVMGYCFDDLGTEANGKHFGKEKNVMAEILLNRYDNQLEGKYTHITTNLTADEIKNQYGSRVTDRMREMFNLIIFDKNAKSRRV